MPTPGVLERFEDTTRDVDVAEDALTEEETPASIEGVGDCAETKRSSELEVSDVSAFVTSTGLACEASAAMSVRGSKDSSNPGALWLRNLCVFLLWGFLWFFMIEGR